MLDTVEVWEPSQLAQIGRLKAVHIERPQIQSAANAIVNHYLVNRDGIDHGFLFVGGLQGTGKTLVLERAMKEIARRKGEEGARPVAYFKLPENCTRKDFMSCCLEAIGDPSAHIGTRTSMAQRFRRNVVKKGIEMLMVDELGHIVNSDNNEVNFVTADLLKLVTEDFKKGVVLAGLPGALRVMQSNEQLSGRRHAKIELELLSMDTDPQVQECQRSLRTFDEDLPFVDYCMLADPRQVLAHLEASHGNPRLLVRLTRHAGSSAIRDRARRIEMEHWQRAWEELRKDLGPAKRNPYSGLSLPAPTVK